MNEAYEEKRATTVHDRYHITDDCCGMVETAMTKADAFRIAESHLKRHRKDPDDRITHVNVWDNMAKRGAQHEWKVQ